MTNRQALLKEIEHMPSNIIDEVYHYVSYLKNFKTQGKLGDITLASEQALAKDWLLPEEDAAWGNL